MGALEPGLWKRPKKTTSMASMIDEADFVAIMARHRDSIEVGSPMLPIDVGYPGGIPHQFTLVWYVLSRSLYRLPIGSTN